MRFLLAVFAVWFAILLVPDQQPVVSAKPSAGVEITEKVWLSRTCTDSRWYLEEADDQTATLRCYQPASDDDGSN